MISKKTTQRQGFKTGEFIVYPAHGVGQIVSIDEQEVAGCKLELFVISFVKDKMTLRVPTAKITAVGMRKLAEPTMVKRSLETVHGPRPRQAHHVVAPCPGVRGEDQFGRHLIAIAEVVRDLYRSRTQPEQSYSERQLYEAALDRMSREIASVQRITETEAIKEIEAALAKGPRRGKADGEEVVLRRRRPEVVSGSRILANEIKARRCAGLFLLSGGSRSVPTKLRRSEPPLSSSQGSAWHPGHDGARPRHHDRGCRDKPGYDH